MKEKGMGLRSNPSMTHIIMGRGLKVTLDTHGGNSERAGSYGSNHILFYLLYDMEAFHPFCFHVNQDVGSPNMAGPVLFE